MMRKVLIIVCGFTAAVLASMGLGRTADKGPFDGPVLVPAKVERVYDADTIYVDALNWPKQIKEVGARVAGVDTPEKRGTGCKRHPLWKSGKLDERQKAFIKAYENELGRASTERVKQLIKPGDWILLRNIQRGKYNSRVVVDVHYASSTTELKRCADSLDLTNCPNLGSLLVKERLAVSYDGGTKGAWWCEGPALALPSPESGEGG